MYIYIYIYIYVVCRRSMLQLQEPRSPPHLVTTTPIVGNIRYGPWLGWYLLKALIPPLHSYPIWQEPWPGPEQTSFIVRICSAIMDMAPGPGPKAQQLRLGLGRAAISDTNAMVG